MTKLEQIARAIYERRNGHGCKPWSRLPREHQVPYLGDARAAVEAIREPSSEMLIAGHGELAVCVAGPDASNYILGDRTCHQGITDCYTAMIEAILTEGKQT